MHPSHDRPKGSVSEIPVFWKSFSRLFEQLVDARSSVVRSAHRQSGGDPLAGHGCFLPQPPGDLYLARICLAPSL